MAEPKNKITSTRTGDVVNIVVDGVRMGKRLPREIWLDLKDKIESYNKREDKDLLEEILAVMEKVKVTKAKEVEKELVEAKEEKKVVDKEIKEAEVVNKEIEFFAREIGDAAEAADSVASGEYTAEDLAKIEALIEKIKNIEAKTAPRAKQGIRRSGEY